MPVISLIRHGQTDSNASGVLQGHLPTSLNALGHRQANVLAERLRSEVPRLEVLVSSDLRRAVQTAEAIGAALGLTPQTDPAWRERGFGDLEGQTLGDVAIWRAASADVVPPGGETISAFEQRIANALLALVRAHQDRAAIGVVTHGGPIRMVLALLAAGRLPQVPEAQPPEVVTIANASILRLTTASIERGQVTWRVMAINDVLHLGGLVTASDAG